MLTIKNIYKSYGKKDNKYPALKDISLSFRPSEFVAILGPSGSGKTTLLNILGGLDHYDAGDLIINGKSTKKFKDKDWDSYRNKSIGFIFQSYNLISHISILSNVEMCLTLRNLSKSEAKKRAIEAVERVGLIDHLHKKPNELSGGQMQRVAIARALVNNPDIILADEPTGALDSKTSTQIMELIKDISKEKLVIMVTHNEELANIYANRIIKLSDGVIVSDSNPYSKEEQDSTYTLPKTKMSVLTALGLSLNNIKTKKGRTLLTSFAASIGIIGISLVLALSNGFQKQIDKFERETLANMPIYIMPEATSFQDELNTAFDMTEEEEYPTDNKIRSYTTDTASYHTNIITDEYLEYIKKLDDKYINGIGYGYRTNMNVLVKNNKVEKFPNYFLDSNLIGAASLDILIENYDLLEGKYPENKNEVILLVDTYNRLSTNLYKALGLSSNNTFADICGKELKIVNNNDYYQEAGNIFLENNDYSSLWDNQNNVSIKITGVIRAKKDATAAIYDESSILTYNELLEDFINNNINSEIIVKQKNSNSNVLTGLEFENDSEKEEAIRSLGGNKIPASIAI